MANFIELSIYTTHEGAEIISDIMWDYTDSGVVINDIQDVIDLSKNGKSWDYLDDDVLKADKGVCVKAYFPVEKGEEIINQIEKRFISLKENKEINFGSLETAKRQIDGDKWKLEWKEHFKPIHIGNVVIVPEWIKYKEKKGEIKVLLDSNMAFGTGEHETTSFCIEKLSKFVKENDTVLDVGTGSGILGICASKLGAKQVIMTDIDECAITASNHNLKLNNVKNAKVFFKNLLDDNSIKGNVIVANIMAEVLIFFANEIGNNLYDGGIIILSGILKDRKDKVKSAYLQNGFTFIEEEVKGEWTVQVFKKGN